MRTEALPMPSVALQKVTLNKTGENQGIVSSTVVRPIVGHDCRRSVVRSAATKIAFHQTNLSHKIVDFGRTSATGGGYSQMYDPIWLPLKFLDSK
jgi:hypothetical protein